MSETLGYIIIFGIITACIAMVFIIGSQIIAQTQERANFQSMEQNFEVISSDISRTAFESSPAMSTRVKIDSGSLVMLPPANSGSIFDFNYNGGNNKTHDKLGILAFNANSNGQSLCLDNGALVQRYFNDGWDNSVMTLHPKIYYSPSSKTLYLAVINLTGDYGGISGGYITNIKSSFVDSSFESYNKDPVLNNDTLYISMRTNYTRAWDGYWNEYFNSTFYEPGRFKVETVVGDWGADTQNWTTAKLSGVDELVVVTYNVNIRI